MCSRYGARVMRTWTTVLSVLSLMISVSDASTTLRPVLPLTVLAWRYCQ